METSTNIAPPAKSFKLTEPTVIDTTAQSKDEGTITTTIMSHSAGPSASPPRKDTARINNFGDGTLTMTREIAAIMRFPTPVPLSVSYPKNWANQEFGLMSQFLADSYGLISNVTGLGSAIDAGKGIGASIKNRSQEAIKRKVLNLSGQAAQGGFLHLNQTELLFQGVDFRELQISHTFAPNSEKELIDSLKIVNIFKKFSAPKKAGAFKLHYPKLFELEFGLNNGGAAGNIFKVKPCACTNVTVDYTPEALWNVFKNGHPVLFKMDLTFKEVELLTDEDFDIGNPFNSH